MTVTPSLGNLSSSGVLSNQVVPQVIVLAQANLPAQTGPAPVVDPTLKLEADAIDAYFKAHDMPLAGTGMEMATVADNNGIDWRLLPAIAVRESTGGKQACSSVKNNPFGWGSCKIGFDSLDQAIETVAANLGGNNPNTASHYDNKTTTQILHSYNPPSIVRRYAEQVMTIMKDIGPADVTATTSSTT